MVFILTAALLSRKLDVEQVPSGHLFCVEGLQTALICEG